jgi:hypothetical protein
MRYSSHELKKPLRRKMQKKRSANNARFRPGTTGACEAQLWTFVGSQRMLKDNDAHGVHWVAAESLDEALRYMRQRYDDFFIMEARFLDMIPLLSGSPLD